MNKIVGFILLVVLLAGGCKIGGTITTSDGTPVAGITVKLSGAATMNTVTDSNGAYSFSASTVGTYTVKPEQSGYVFTPESKSIELTSSGQTITGVNFKATQIVVATYGCSGKIMANGAALKDVTVSLTGTATKTTVTDVNGVYAFQELVNGSYTVTPTLTGYQFTPQKTAIVIQNQDMTNVNFEALKITATYSCTGKILKGATPLSGITVSLSGIATKTATTDSTGTYTFSNLTNGNYIASPSHACLTFSPASIYVTINGGNATGINFSAASASAVWEGDYDTADHNGSLQDLAGYTSITGNLFINGTALNHLGGLECLNTIEGDLYIWSNDTLTSLAGLGSLTSVGGYMDIYYNSSLTNVQGLNNVVSIGEGLFITENSALTSLQGFEKLSSIGDYLYISDNGALTNLTGLNNLKSVGGYLAIYNNATLNNLTGLNSLTSIEGLVEISDNPALATLSGLNNLSSIGEYLRIGNNPHLSSLQDLAKLAAIGGSLTITENDVLTNLQGLNAVVSLGGTLEISGNDILSSIGALASLNSVGESVIVTNNDTLTNLTGIELITSIPKDLRIEGNQALNSLDALVNLIYVGGSLSIKDDDSLTRLTGLDNLTNVGNYLYIWENDGLTNMTGLTNLIAIGYLSIRNNSALVSVDGFDSMNTVGRDFKIEGNNALTSLTGFVELAMVGGKLEILSNAALCTSLAQALVTAIEEENIVGPITISNNKGC